MSAQPMSARPSRQSRTIPLRRQAPNRVTASRTLLDMAKDREASLALANNLKRLMEHQGLSQNELARKSGIGQRSLSTILNLERPLEINPRSTTITAIASYFGIPAWQLLIPDLPLELMLSHRLTKLIENYRDAPEVGRTNVDRVSESEVRYGDNQKSANGN